MDRHRASASEGMTGATGPQAHLSDLDRLATETRDTGKLSEPLADSVLDYTLRRLKPDANVDSRTVQELEKTLYPDDLSQLMEVNSIFPWQNSLTSMMRLDGQSYSGPLDQGNNGAARISSIPGPWERMRNAHVPSVQSNGYDWWQLSLDSIQQPVLPGDELFSLDFNA